MERRRWDIDERFTGIASGRALADPVRRLAEHLEREGWVTEDPDAHLLPHLRRWCERPGSGWRLLEARLLDDGVYEVELEPTGGTPVAGLLVRDVIPLLAQVAETSFAVRQVGDDIIECVTGMLDDDGPYAAHGHLIRVRICRPPCHSLVPEASETAGP
ncbi:hypothetical protein ACFQ78_41280 [Streptomyces sp. NPDC056519]|uniref:hypothetical protein n=1 Tax=Streptomyces sp. NPDC056519 TaxID=3345849 RepID=UPI0036C0880C